MSPAAMCASVGWIRLHERLHDLEFDDDGDLEMGNWPTTSRRKVIRSIEVGRTRVPGRSAMKPEWKGCRAN